MRNRGTIGLVTYDRRGNPYHALDGAYGLYETNSRSFMDGAHPYLSRCHVHVFDKQTGNMIRLEQVRSLSGGHVTRINDPAT